MTQGQKDLARMWLQKQIAAIEAARIALLFCEDDVGGHEFAVATKEVPESARDWQASLAHLDLALIDLRRALAKLEKDGAA